jgi:hypothetical protein
VDEDRVWVMSGAGHVVEIDRSQWQIRGWYEIGRALPASSIIDHSWLLPRRRTAWAEVRSAPGSEGYIHIIDLDRMASTRTLTWSGMPIHIGTAGARVVALEVHRSELALISDRGQISRRIHLPEGMSATCVVEGLMEDSMMILGYREHPTETLAHEPGLHLLVATAEAQIKKVRELQGDLDRGHELIIARAAGLVLLVYEDLESGERKLTALEPDGLGFSEAYTVEVPAPISIFSDHASQRVVVGFRRAGRLELMELSRTPPDFKGIDRAPVSNLPKFERFWFCGLGRRAEKAASRPLLAPVDASSERALRAWLDGQRASQSEPDALLAALLAAQSQDRWGACDEFRAWLFAAHGRVPSIAYEIANEAANRADWKTVEAALSGFDEEAFAASVRQHRSHILGIAALAHGRVREAVELWRQGSRHEGDCELHPYLELCGAAEPEQASGHVDSLVAAIRDADAALAAGKPREARACLSSFSALMRREIQSSARLAAAHLAMEPASASELLEARFCLARFVGLFDRDSNDTLILPPPMQTWRGKHLEDLGERARSWLDQTRSVLRERPQALI